MHVHLGMYLYLHIFSVCVNAFCLPDHCLHMYHSHVFTQYIYDTCAPTPAGFRATYSTGLHVFLKVGTGHLYSSVLRFSSAFSVGEALGWECCLA